MGRIINMLKDQIVNNQIDYVFISLPPKQLINSLDYELTHLLLAKFY